MLNGRLSSQYVNPPIPALTEEQHSEPHAVRTNRSAKGANRFPNPRMTGATHKKPRSGHC